MAHKIKKDKINTSVGLLNIPTPASEIHSQNTRYVANQNFFKHEGALYKEVFPGKIEAHLSVTVKVRGSNSKWRAI